MQLLQLLRLLLGGRLGRQQLNLRLLKLSFKSFDDVFEFHILIVDFLKFLFELIFLFFHFRYFFIVGFVSLGEVHIDRVEGEMKLLQFLVQVCDLVLLLFNACVQVLHHVVKLYDFFLFLCQ